MYVVIVVGEELSFGVIALHSCERLMILILFVLDRSFMSIQFVQLISLDDHVLFSVPEKHGRR
jgi:hypothetical protein